MKFIKAKSPNGLCYIPVSSISSINISDENEVYCVQVQGDSVWVYYDLTEAFPNPEQAEAAMDAIVKGINYND